LDVQAVTISRLLMSVAPPRPVSISINPLLRAIQTAPFEFGMVQFFHLYIMNKTGQRYE